MAPLWHVAVTAASHSFVRETKPAPSWRIARVGMTRWVRRCSSSRAPTAPATACLLSERKVFRGISARALATWERPSAASCYGQQPQVPLPCPDQPRRCQPPHDRSEISGTSGPRSADDGHGKAPSWAPCPVLTPAQADFRRPATRRGEVVLAGVGSEAAAQQACGQDRFAGRASSAGRRRPAPPSGSPWAGPSGADSPQASCCTGWPDAA